MERSVRVRAYTTPQYGCRYSEELAFAQLAEAQGFDGYFRADHYVPMVEGHFPPGPTDAWVSLAGIARETERVRLGALVSAALFRLPGAFAVMFAQIDEMSGGRLEFGLGAGWLQSECDKYGIPFPGTKDRLDMLDEQLAIILGMWDTPTGEQFSFEGKHYQVMQSPALPKPIQQPRPPVILGAGGPRRAPMRVARLADEASLAWSTPAQVAEAIGRVRGACDEIGRNPEELRYSIATQIVCGESQSEIGRRREAIGVTEETMWERGGVCGTPDQVVEGIRRYLELGVDTVYLQFHELQDLAHLKLVGESVLPKLSGSVG